MSNLPRMTNDGKPIDPQFGDKHPSDPLVLAARGVITPGEAVMLRDADPITVREYLQQRGKQWHEVKRDGTVETDLMRAEMYAGLCMAENVCTDLPHGAPYLNVAAAIALGKQCEAAQ